MNSGSVIVCWSCDKRVGVSHVKAGRVYKIPSHTQFSFFMFVSICVEVTMVIKVLSSESCQSTLTTSSPRISPSTSCWPTECIG